MYRRIETAAAWLLTCWRSIIGELAACNHHAAPCPDRRQVLLVRSCEAHRRHGNPGVREIVAAKPTGPKNEMQDKDARGVVRSTGTPSTQRRRDTGMASYSRNESRRDSVIRMRLSDIIGQLRSQMRSGGAVAANHYRIWGDMPGSRSFVIRMYTDKHGTILREQVCVKHTLAAHGYDPQPTCVLRVYCFSDATGVPTRVLRGSSVARASARRAAAMSPLHLSLCVLCLDARCSSTHPISPPLQGRTCPACSTPHPARQQRTLACGLRDL